MESSPPHPSHGASPTALPHRSGVSSRRSPTCCWPLTRKLAAMSWTPAIGDTVLPQGCHLERSPPSWRPSWKGLSPHTLSLPPSWEGLPHITALLRQGAGGAVAGEQGAALHSGDPPHTPPTLLVQSPHTDHPFSPTTALPWLARGQQVRPLCGVLEGGLWQHWWWHSCISLCKRSTARLIGITSLVQTGRSPPKKIFRGLPTPCSLLFLLGTTGTTLETSGIILGTTGTTLGATVTMLGQLGPHWK